MIAAALAWATRAVSGLWLKVAGFAVAAAAVLAIYASIRKGGRDAQRADDAIANLKVKERMEDAEAKGPRTGADVVGRLHNHDF